jgi:hypothetical protein
MTIMLSWMQAPEQALALLWENIGMHEHSSETGTQRAVTSDGLKQLPLNYSPGHSSPFTAQTTTLDAMVTIMGLMPSARIISLAALVQAP